ncbi:MAG: aldehyde dehydrogenase family protein [Defluviimonas sp.]|uniref:aldehyde dehydrogenase family protein n=1 Tax=Albidovulum sp. TaxID=1872424 RepID=UPI001DDBA170|nr:aldehyde dehydrogenase family protein [Paracoccaceae bacterium]MCC0064110.1 aldehyde dehydrogenase family protein [Defluviimonas sp.]
MPDPGPSAAPPPETARLRALLDAQAAAFAAAPPPDADRRRTDLARLKAAIRAGQQRLVRAAAEDFGRRSASETLINDLGQAVQAINHARRHLKRWMRPERRSVGWLLRPGRAEIRFQPKGVIGIMAPWNYPFNLVLVPLVSAIAAGNRAMVKPSELAPASAAALAELLAATFAEDQVAAVLGGPATGAAFAALPFDHLVFTGSTAVGPKVMRAAAENLVPVTLELGGKSPAIVAPGADPEAAAREIAYGKLTNGGQTCIAPDYVLVPEPLRPALVAALAAEMARIAPEGGGDPGLTTIIDAGHAERLRALLAEAEAAGARVTRIGAPGAGRAIGPALVETLPEGVRLLREEIFGPLLPIVGYDGIDAAIAHVNAGPRPLALYYFGPGGPLLERVLARTVSGNVTVNGALTHFAVDTLPFGGIGESGMGACHGEAGFLALSHARGIFHQPRRSLIPLGRAPGGRFARLTARLLMR